MSGVGHGPGFERAGMWGAEGFLGPADWGDPCKVRDKELFFYYKNDGADTDLLIAPGLLQFSLATLAAWGHIAEAWLRG